MNGGCSFRRAYKGLARFDDSELDERFFFGRDRETEIVASNLVASRLSVLYGPSGVGKSSLLGRGSSGGCALVPAGGGGGDGERRTAGRGRPVARRPAGRDRDRGRRSPRRSRRRSSPDVLAERSAEIGGEIYLVLDQMEEYFVYHGRDHGGPLREALAEILTRPTLRVHVLLGIRDDALAELDAFKGRVPGLFGNVLRLDHLDVDAARAAIVEPLAELEAMGGPHVVAEAALVAAVVDQVASGRIERRLAGRGIVAGGPRRGRVEAPYLQLVMERIWEVERGRGSYVLHAETLDRAGRRRPDRPAAPRACARDARRAGARARCPALPPAGDAVGDEDRARRRRPEPVCRRVARAARGRPARALGRAGRPRAPGRNGGGPRYEIYHDVLADAVLDWGARHEAERALRRASGGARRHRRIAAIIVLGAVALASMGILTAYAFSQRTGTERCSGERERSRRRSRRLRRPMPSREERAEGARSKSEAADVEESEQTAKNSSRSAPPKPPSCDDETAGRRERPGRA